MKIALALGNYHPIGVAGKAVSPNETGAVAYIKSRGPDRPSNPDELEIRLRGTGGPP